MAGGGTAGNRFGPSVAPDESLRRPERLLETASRPTPEDPATGALSARRAAQRGPTKPARASRKPDRFHDLRRPAFVTPRLAPVQFGRSPSRRRYPLPRDQAAVEPARFSFPGS